MWRTDLLQLADRDRAEAVRGCGGRDTQGNRGTGLERDRHRQRDQARPRWVCHDQRQRAGRAGHHLDDDGGASASMWWRAHGRRGECSAPTKARRKQLVEDDLLPHQVQDGAEEPRMRERHAMHDTAGCATAVLRVVDLRGRQRRLRDRLRARPSAPTRSLAV